MRTHDGDYGEEVQYGTVRRNGKYQIRHSEQSSPLPYLLLSTARDHALRMSGIIDWEYEIWQWHEGDADYRYLETWDRRCVRYGQKVTMWHYLHGPSHFETMECAPHAYPSGEGSR